MAVKKTKKVTKRIKSKTKSVARRGPAKTKGKGTRKKPLGGKVRIRVSHNRVSTPRSEFKAPLAGMIGGHNRRAVEQELSGDTSVSDFIDHVTPTSPEAALTPPVVTTTDAEGRVVTASLVCTEDSVLGVKDDVETADEDDDSSASDSDTAAPPRVFSEVQSDMDDCREED